MSINRALALLILALLTFSLAACELSASTPPPTTATTEGSLETLRAELSIIGTQTAAAGGGAGPVVPTNPPAEATAVPPSAEEATPGTTEAPTAEPATNTPVEVPEATPGLPKNYTLKEGEFPFCIARRFNVDVAELLSTNGLGLNSVVPVGFTLRIPQAGNKFAGDRSLRDHPTTYTVAAGDTIYTIACKYGDVDPLVIAKINDLKEPYNLKSGQKLNIP